MSEVQQVSDLKFHMCRSPLKKFENSFETQQIKKTKQKKQAKFNLIRLHRQSHVINLAAI